LLVTRWRVEEIPTPRVPRRFPVGAGDVFLAAYLHARVRDRSPIAAARFAVRVSAEHVEHGHVRAALDAREAST